MAIVDALLVIAYIALLAVAVSILNWPPAEEITNEAVEAEKVVECRIDEVQVADDLFVLLLYKKESDEFLGQGTSMSDILSIIRTTFHNTTVLVEYDNSTFPIVT